MNLVKKVKIYIVVFSACILFLITLGGLYFEQNSCMGISIIPENRLDSYRENLNIDVSEITFNGERVAADVISNTIYISQSPDVVHQGLELQGKIATNNPSQKLYLLDNAQLQDLSKTVKDSEYLTLVVVENKSYCKINVVITTLPVMSISGKDNGETTEMGYFIFVGDMTLFAGEDPSVGKMSVETYPVKWHIRGGKSIQSAKKALKLTLKKKNNENLNVDILGMGSDDDWILNSMSIDDTKLREKTALDVWNNYIKKESDYPMSVAEYVEVVVNGEYQGLFLVERRIDAKYLQLDKKKDILFKGRYVYTPYSLYDGYEIIYSPYDLETTYLTLWDYLYTVDIDNYVNTNIYLEYLSALDNTGYKNMFYVLRHEDDGTYKMHFVLWDTDMSMGLISNTGSTHKYDYDTSMEQRCRRMLYYNIMLEYPDLDEKMAERWFELSGTVFGPDGKWEQTLETNKQYILDSGALIRDNECWGLSYGGADSIDNLFRWSKEKTAQIDEYWKKQ